MTAYFDTKRLCPFCGRQVLLADCPIVATNPEAERELRNLLEEVADDNLSEVVLQGWRPPKSDSSNGDYWDVHSRVDEEERLAVAPPPSWSPPQVRQRNKVAEVLAPTGAPRLPDTLEATAQIPAFGIEPRRACSVCGHPMPQEIDDRHVSTIVIAGITQASKSTLLTRLCRQTALGKRFIDLGFAEFVELEESPDDLDVLAARVHRGERLERTEAPAQGGQYLPWSFLATGLKKRQPYLLFLHDVAGETYQNRTERARQAPFLGWADAVIFLVDPEPYVNPASRSAAWNQAKVLQGLLSAARPNAPVAVALAKADMLQFGPDSVTYDGSAVKEALERIGAGPVVEAAGARVGTSFHFVAAHPEGGAEPFGVIELFAGIASRCGLL